MRRRWVLGAAVLLLLGAIAYLTSVLITGDDEGRQVADLTVEGSEERRNASAVANPGNAVRKQEPRAQTVVDETSTPLARKIAFMITGRINLPSPSAERPSVTWYRADGTSIDGRVDADGRFRVTIAASRFARLPGSVLVRVGQRANLVRVLLGDKGKTYFDLGNVALRRSRSLQVRVEAEKKHAANARVVLRHTSGGRIRTTMTDNSGIARFRSVPTSTYTVTATKGALSRTKTFTSGMAGRKVFTLRSYPERTISVIDTETRKPIENAVLTLRDGTRKLTGRDGTAKITSDPGSDDETITVRAKGYFTEETTLGSPATHTFELGAIPRIATNINELSTVPESEAFHAIHRHGEFWSIYPVPRNGAELHLPPLGVWPRLTRVVSRRRFFVNEDDTDTLSRGATNGTLSVHIVDTLGREVAGAIVDVQNAVEPTARLDRMR